MKVVSILGRIPVLRDTLQLPALKSDGKVVYLTPREALEMEEKTKLHFEEDGRNNNDLLTGIFDLFKGFFTKLGKFFS